VNRWDRALFPLFAPVGLLLVIVAFARVLWGDDRSDL
jgi:hypothetical protein